MSSATVVNSRPASSSWQATAASSRTPGTSAVFPSAYPVERSRSTISKKVYLSGSPVRTAAAGRRGLVADRRGLVVSAGIKAVEKFNSTFVLDTVAEEQLVEMLSSEAFCNQVASNGGKEGKTMEFSGHLFQPTPYALSEPHGMPKEFEQYLHDKENYVFINVPPNFMVKAKIFKPSRLCAIFKVKA